ncbi:MAG TPA: hypothetical protein VND90_03600 [Terracidiphilus sp.]|nr:hypothetical protein [Terracidiphilus sp.]
MAQSIALINLAELEASAMVAAASADSATEKGLRSLLDEPGRLLPQRQALTKWTGSGPGVLRVV